MNTDLFDPPRWPGGPKICKAENLPAFQTVKEMAAFHDSLPGVKTLTVKLCPVCDCYHAYTKPRSPSGDSSGSSRR